MIHTEHPVWFQPNREAAIRQEAAAISPEARRGARGYRAGTSEMCTFLSGTPHACTTQPQLVKLQEVKILLIPHRIAKTDCENSLVIKSYMHISHVWDHQGALLLVAIKDNN